MLKRDNLPLVVVLGPTAVGKTKVAVNLAHRIEGEVISADSRQVYRKMDIGTGKDLNEYRIGEKNVPYHLIDILEAGEEYDLFNFQRDFYQAVADVQFRAKVPILCGGTGMYLEAAISPFQLLEVPEDNDLRKELASMSLTELEEILRSLNPDLHNTTDTEDRNRAIRAIEIEKYKKEHQPERSAIQNYRLYGIRMDREQLRSRIKERLDQRLQEGMIKEVESLLNDGIEADKLFYYGLEYRYIAQYLIGEIDYNQMYTSLLQGIRRFAKKQMTWYRRMEKKGEDILWFDANEGIEKICQKIIKDLENATI
ncbi:MAG: tRNA (adenosine(37)-N6)-dimethylallyltransferase MiaA [Flavobacteriales bacterium]|nr:tRNA (adenosine(37)-N6)-dimethylallyltransferase MiaA [Flavobacteriales bacterium]|tara:strand:- start:768 stop:1700 length:933 start_codon:yes stop_codon:yes gene_type:complete